MRRDAELLITTVARTGRAVAAPADHANPAPAAPAPAAARSAPEPVHVGAHGAKGRKLSAEEELAALAGQVERPSSSPEGLFAKVAQMAAAADVAVPVPAPTPVARDDRPKEPPVRPAALRVPRTALSARRALYRWHHSARAAPPAVLNDALHHVISLTVTGHAYRLPHSFFT